MGTNARVVTVLISMIAIIIGLYLQFLVLTKIEATEFMWFLYIINIPILMLATALTRLVQDSKS